MRRILLLIAVLALFLPNYAAGIMYGVSGGGGSNPGSFMTIDENTGAVTILDTPYGGSGLTGLATDSTGRVFAVTSVDNPDVNSHLIEINPATGAMIADIGQLLDASGNQCAIGDLSFQPGTNVLFGLAANHSFGGIRCGIGGGTGGYLMTIDTTTAQYTIIGRDESLDNDNGGIAFAPNGTLYFTPGWNNNWVILTLDPATANILTTQVLDPVSAFMGLAVRPSDGTIFAGFPYGGGAAVYTIDPTTGAVTFVGNTDGIMVHDLTFDGASQPDLIVSSLAAGIRTFGTPMIRGVFANYMVMNQGSADAVSSCLDFYLSRDAVIDPGDVYLGRENIPGLTAGNSYSGFKDFRRSFNNWQPASGTWHVIADSDACDDNEESDETNNQTSTVAAIVK